jgi:hypothetical protein
MALRGALVDRVRVHSRRPVAAQRVEGSTHMTEYVGPLIRARLSLPQSPESVDEPARGRRRAVTNVPTLMVLDKDELGQPVVITTEHRLGVFSKEQFGEGVEVLFEVTADPEPIRKKRKVIGWMLTMRRVADHAAEPLAGVA